MQKDPYLILGLTSDATQEQVETAYRELRAKYQELRYSEGEVGMDASLKLNELDTAYSDCIDDLQKRITYENYGSGYGEIQNLIKENRLEEAQSLLDKVETRDAEWHYVQSILYYRRNWHLESKKQLEIALTLDENNEKYKGAYERLNKKLSGNNATGNTQQAGAGAQQQQTRAGYERPAAAAGGSNANACCDTCSSLLCCDCCCECFGGDLIPCC